MLRAILAGRAAVTIDHACEQTDAGNDTERRVGRGADGLVGMSGLPLRIGESLAGGGFALLDGLAQAFA